MKNNQPKTRSKELKDQLEMVEYKIRCEMDYARKVLHPLKVEQRNLLEKIKKLDGSSCED
tara:strand:- start:374 stop:553 length:180 start_codon:yes stop_codon:yes gene_type:complete